MIYILTHRLLFDDRFCKNLLIFFVLKVLKKLNLSLKLKILQTNLKVDFILNYNNVVQGFQNRVDFNKLGQ